MSIGNIRSTISRSYDCLSFSGLDVIVELNGTPEHASELVHAVVEDEELRAHALALHGDLALRFMDQLQNYITSHPTAENRPAVIRLLQDMSDKVDDLPLQYWLTGVERRSRQIQGVEADIWSAYYAGALVVLRDIRLPGENDVPKLWSVRKLIRREIIAQRQLQHPNILSLVGIFRDSKHPLSIVTPWIEQGHVKLYLPSHPHHFLRIICGVAQGLSYLHTRNPPIIHGDIRGSNILVNMAGTPVLSDFGLSRIRHEVARDQTMSVQGTSSRYLAPELVTAMHFRATLPTDCYAFAMTIVELGTLKHPFIEYPNDFAVPIASVQGVRPLRPSQMASLSQETIETLWRLLEEMWSQRPENRPVAVEIETSLKIINHDNYFQAGKALLKSCDIVPLQPSIAVVLGVSKTVATLTNFRAEFSDLIQRATSILGIFQEHFTLSPQVEPIIELECSEFHKELVKIENFIKDLTSSYRVQLWWHSASHNVALNVFAVHMKNIHQALTNDNHT